MTERKGYATKDQSQAEETTSEQQHRGPLDEILSQAEKAYMAYMEAERQVAQAYHENEIQVAKAYKQAGQQAQRTFDEAVREAQSVREEAIAQALNAREISLEMAEKVFRESKEQADKTCEEILTQALKAREDRTAKAWDTYQKAMLDAWKIFTRQTNIRRFEIPTEEEPFLQTLASAFKEELAQPFSADHFDAIKHASRHRTNENIETAKRMLRAQRRAAGIRSKD